MAQFRTFVQWLKDQRSSTRLGFVLQTSSRIGFALMALVWTPLLVGVMGKGLNGLFLTFQGITSLGGLGDLGMGGYVNIRTSRLLGQGKEPELCTFLASARAAFLLFAIVVGGGFAIISPGLFGWLKFFDEPAVGMVNPLIAVGVATISLLVLNSYTNNLNYGCSNITWPIMPLFVAGQLAALTHWLLAREGSPLWLQCLPYALSAAAIHLMGWGFVKASHPVLATVRPLNFSRRDLLNLAGQSLWVYLYSIPVIAHIMISRLLINGVFGPEHVPVYAYNNRLAELAMFVITSASLASMPKITQWLASPERAQRERAITELKRLNKFQTLLGAIAVLVYLHVNDSFIRFWLGADFHAPLSWQAAFAGFLGVTAGGLAGFDLAARCSEKGIRVGGSAAACSTICNLLMCGLAVHWHSILGIALAALLTQSGIVLFLGWYSSRQLGVSWWELSVKNCLLALAMVGVGLASRRLLALQMGLAIPAVMAVNLTALFLAIKVIGLNWQDFRSEWSVFLALLGRRKNSTA